MASDAAIPAALALQFGCWFGIPRKTLKRDSQRRAIGPLGIALNVLAAEDKDETT